MHATLVPAAIFFFNDTAPTEIYTLPLHAALPIYPGKGHGRRRRPDAASATDEGDDLTEAGAPAARRAHALFEADRERSEEHTSELQSHLNLVCRLLLEKKKIGPGTHCTAGRQENT